MFSEIRALKQGFRYDMGDEIHAEFLDMILVTEEV